MRTVAFGAMALSGAITGSARLPFFTLAGVLMGLAGIAQPTLVVSSEDSPDVLRRVNDRLAEALPNTEKVLVKGGHLIHPAHPAILDFLGRILPSRGTRPKKTGGSDHHHDLATAA